MVSVIDEGSVFSKLVGGFAAATNTEILAAFPAHFDACLDVPRHPRQIRPLRQLGEKSRLIIPSRKSPVLRVLQSQQLRRERRNVARPIHAGDSKGFDQLIMER